MVRHFVQAVLAVVITAGWAVTQHEPVEKHVPEITAESKAKYPHGVADSPLCQWARKQNPPYSRFRLHELDPATIKENLVALMDESDEVVMVGATLRSVTVLSPSGENTVGYIDARVLRTWRGSHKVGDVLTFGLPQGSLTCGSGHNEFSGTMVGPSPQVLYHTPNPAYGPDGPYVLFLRRQGENPEIEAFRLAGGNGVQGLFNFVLGSIHFRSPYDSCYRASYDEIWCHSDPHGWQPEWCRDPKIDAQNIARCNAATSLGTEPIFANGVDHDPVRKEYDGKPIGNFLRAVQAADQQAHSEKTQETKP